MTRAQRFRASLSIARLGRLTCKKAYIADVSVELSLCSSTSCLSFERGPELLPDDSRCHESIGAPVDDRKQITRFRCLNIAMAVEARYAKSGGGGKGG